MEEHKDMNKKRAGLAIGGILFIVIGVIVFIWAMKNADITMKIGGCCVMVGGLVFLMESVKKNKDNN